MNSIAAFIAHLRANGFSDAQIAVACEAYGAAIAEMEGVSSVSETSRVTPGALRQKRWRERNKKRLKASQSVTEASQGVTRDVTRDITPSPPSPSLPPTPPITTPSSSSSTPSNGEFGFGETAETQANSSSKPKRQATRLPEDWQPLDDDWDKVKASGLSDDEIRYEHQKFTDWARAAPGQKGVKLDWDATWRNWMRKAADDKRGKAERQKAFDARFGAKH